MLGKRIAVLGPTGSGKSTLGAEIARRLGLTFIELDAINWLPNWAEKPKPQFLADLEAALDAAGGGWVVAGNYKGKTDGLVLKRADTIVWLNLPFRVTFAQLLRRTISRSLRKELLWGTNYESWRKAFMSRDSILLWGITSRKTHAPSTRAALKAASHARVLELRSRKEVRALLNGVHGAVP